MQFNFNQKNKTNLQSINLQEKSDKIKIDKPKSNQLGKTIPKTIEKKIKNSSPKHIQN